MNLGERLKQLRKSNKISAKSFANDIGVSNVFLSYIENGTKKPSLDTLEKICSALNITLADFFTVNTNKPEINIDEVVKELQNLTPSQLEAIKLTAKAMNEGRPASNSQ